MRNRIAAALATAALLTNTSWAQLDLGGTISGAINGATGNAQAGAQAGAQTGVQNTQPPHEAPPKAAVGANVNAGANASAPAVPNVPDAVQSGTTAVQSGVNAATSAAQSAPSATAAAQAAPSATANTQRGAGANVQGGLGANAGLQGSAAQNATQSAGQGWLGRVGNDIRGALQQADNGVLRLQNNLNPSLQQYGFRPGDQLLDVNGQPLTQAQFDQYLQSNPNQVRVLRNGQTVVLSGNMQGNAQFNQNQMGQGRMQGRQRFGITMNPGGVNGEGVMISGVTVGSPAAQAGLRPGDQIIAVNGQAVSDPNSMIQLVGAAPQDQALDVQYRRNGQVMQSQVMLAAYSSPQGNYQAGYAHDGRMHTQGNMQRQCRHQCTLGPTRTQLARSA